MHHAANRAARQKPREPAIRTTGSASGPAGPGEAVRWRRRWRGRQLAAISRTDAARPAGGCEAVWLAASPGISAATFAELAGGDTEVIEERRGGAVGGE